MFKRLSKRQLAVLPQKTVSPLVFYRNYRLDQQAQKDKYDQFIRQVMDKNRLKGDNLQVNDSREINGKYGNPIRVSSTLLTKESMPLKTMLLLLMGSGSVAMAAFIIYQYMQFDNEESNHIFIPLMIHTNLFGKKKYQFPIGIRYFNDEEYYRYLLEEIDRLELGNGQLNLHNYQNNLQLENIKYKILETVSSNSHIKQIFGLPLNINSPSDFHIWIENKYPTISGLNFFNNKILWSIKLIRISQTIDDILVSLGLKLNRLDSHQIKIHEKSSGKIHEVPIEDKNIILNKNKDYQIKFTGNFIIQDKQDHQTGVIEYLGVIDFDHLMINRGIKIKSMNLIMNEDKNSEKVSYKIL